MAAGAWISIRDSFDHSIPAGRARVTNNRLWVDATLGAAVVLVVQVTEGDVTPPTPELVPTAVQRRDGFLPSLEADGEWTHLLVDNLGALWVRDETRVTESVAVTAAPLLIPIAAERDDVLTALPELDGEWVHLRTDSEGALWVRETNALPLCEHGVEDCSSEILMVGGCGDVLNGNGGDNACCALQMDVLCNLKTVDQQAVVEGNVVPASPDLFPVGAERDDVLTTLPEPDGDWVHFRTDSRGALWVRDSVPIDHLSGSTNGQPIRIVAVATPGTILHTAVVTVGEVDKIWIWLSNTSTVQETVTIEFGAVGVGNEMDFKIPANDTILAVGGWALGGAAGQIVRAFSTAANVIQATGHFERVLNP